MNPCGAANLQMTQKRSDITESHDPRHGRDAASPAAASGAQSQRSDLGGSVDLFTLL